MDKMRGKVLFSYDQDGDVLYSYVNKPRPAKSIDMQNGIHLRVDPVTSKVVGFTILDYQKRVARGTLTSVPHFGNCQLPRPWVTGSQHRKH